MSSSELPKDANKELSVCLRNSVIGLDSSH